MAGPTRRASDFEGLAPSLSNTFFGVMIVAFLLWYVQIVVCALLALLGPCVFQSWPPPLGCIESTL
jgi:hypothetical protein